MKTISTHSYKGGTGKTTFLLNLAGKMAVDGKDILAVDYDLRAPSFQSYFVANTTNYLSDYLLDNATFSNVKINCKFNQDKQMGLILSSMEFLKQHSNQRDKLSRDDTKFLGKLYDLKEHAKNNYDYMFLDTIPGFFYRSIDAMMISDIIIVVTTPSTSDVNGIKELCSNIYGMLKEETDKMILLINKIGTKGVERDKEIFNANLTKLHKLGRSNFDIVFEIPNYGVLSERIHAFEEKPNQQFLEKIKEISNELL